ncbi:MAG: NINE protein [Aeromicrobium sp.]|uniref:NINE protein n=1 Tax=Aeromicrobium sp. TaxID=1871063 RepID=UPI0039E50AD6
MTQAADDESGWDDSTGLDENPEETMPAGARWVLTALCVPVMVVYLASLYGSLIDWRLEDDDTAYAVQCAISVVMVGLLVAAALGSWTWRAHTVPTILVGVVVYHLLVAPLLVLPILTRFDKANYLLGTSDYYFGDFGPLGFFDLGYLAQYLFGRGGPFGGIPAPISTGMALLTLVGTIVWMMWASKWTAVRPLRAALSSGEASEVPEGQYHIVVMGEAVGPYDAEGLKAQAVAGRVYRHTQVSRNGGQWFSAVEVPGLFRPGGDKQFIVALLLSIFGGGLGLDRFYLGYTGLGVAKLLTAGGCGIWSLVDVILVATGRMVAADGSELVR